MRRSDPLPVPQLAIPVGVIEMAYKLGYATRVEKMKAVADLSIVAFYYLLRVGEYTKPRQATINGQQIRATRTVQFRLKDIGFFDTNNRLINVWTTPQHLLLNVLFLAKGAVLKISNQKNGRMGQTIFQECIPDVLDGPTQALARRVVHIVSNKGSPESLLCDYYDKPDQQHPNQIKSTDMIQMIRHSVKALGLQHQGIDPDLVGAHSPRAGGAMALKLSGKDDTTIMKYGRWSGFTFLMYIHNQIAHLAAGVSQDMRNPVPFVNIGNITLPDS